MQVLNFYSTIFADQLKRGRKTATIRLGDKSHKYQKNQLVLVTIGYQHSPREKIFDAVIEDVGSGREGRRVEGKKAILDWFKIVADSWSDATYKPLRVVAEGRTVMWEWRWEGTQTADFVDAKGAGRRVNFRGVTIWDLEDGKIKHEVTLYNYSTLLHQLGKD